MGIDDTGATDRAEAATIRLCTEVVLPRTIAIPSGGALEVRPVRADDVSQLVSLYERLDDDDRYRRFFSFKRPEPCFFERLVEIGERGGAGIVVVDVGGADGEPGALAADRDAPIVAEASYELLGNGNGEMAITVDRDWRGWLGPYLLGVLCAVAASRGIANLEAEILTLNRQMRSLTRSRGEVYLPGSDWESVRVAFPTSGPTPVWSSIDRPRVLLEMRGSPWEPLADLAASGYEVVACSGPATRTSPCPLLDGRECPLAAGADAIVIALPEEDRVDELIQAHTARHGTVPVVAIDRSAGQRVTAEMVAGLAAPPRERGTETTR